MGTIVVLLKVLFLFCCIFCESVSSTSQFRVIHTRCMNSTLMSVWRKPQPATSLLDCFSSSRSNSLHSVGVLQWDKRDQSCSLFRFQQVCQLLSLINVTAVEHSERHCETVIDSEYDAITANEHFAAVWVAERGPMLENLVCKSEGQRNLMRSSGVSWTSDGARMDGVTSRLWVNDSLGLDFSTGYTWILHLKRIPRDQCFIELTDCDTTMASDHLWEYASNHANNRSLYLNPGRTTLFEAFSVLPIDPNEFFIAGASFDRESNSAKFFLGSSFLPDIHKRYSGYVYSTVNCVKIGWRDSNSGLLRGTVRAVAMSGSAEHIISEGVIRKLFWLG